MGEIIPFPVLKTNSFVDIMEKMLLKKFYDQRSGSED